MNLFVNNRWCNLKNITIIARVYELNIEILAIGLCCYYLPHKYSHAIFLEVYILPHANHGAAADAIHSIGQGYSISLEWGPVHEYHPKSGA